MGFFGALFGAGAPEVWFIHAKGCPACAAALPEVVKAARALQRERSIRFHDFDLTHEQWRATNWMPRVTPTLVLVNTGRAFDPRRDVLEAPRDAGSVYRWVRGVLG